MSEVIVPHALTTPQRVKDRLSITVPGHDTILLRLVSGVTDFIESQCDRRFLETVYTNEVYSIHSGTQKHLVLRQVPVTSLSALQYAGGTPSNKSWTSYNADDYELVIDSGASTSLSGMVRLYGYYPQGINTVRATYTAGYKIDFSNAGNPASHNLPFDISDLAERLVARWFKKREAAGKESEGTGDARVDWSKELDEEDVETLNRYKRLFL